MSSVFTKHRVANTENENHMCAAFAPRPPSTPRLSVTPPLHESTDDESAERTRYVLLRAVRHAVVKSSWSKSAPSARRVFGEAFDGNRPRTPPLGGEKKQKRGVNIAKQRSATATSTWGGGRGGGGFLGPTLTTDKHACKATARDTVPVWAPGSEHGVGAWVDDDGENYENGPTAFAAEMRAENDATDAGASVPSRSVNSQNPPTTSLRAMETLRRCVWRKQTTGRNGRDGRQRAWSADASPYSLKSLTGTLPPVARAIRVIFKPALPVSNRGARDGRDTVNHHSPGVTTRTTRTQSARCHPREFLSVTPPRTLRLRLRELCFEKTSWEGKNAAAEVERCALVSERDMWKDTCDAKNEEIANLKRAMETLKKSHAVSVQVGKSEAMEAAALKSPQRRALQKSPPPALRGQTQPSSPTNWSPPLVTQSASPVEDSPPNMWGRMGGFPHSPTRTLDALPAWSEGRGSSPSPPKAGVSSPPTPSRNVHPVGNLEGVLPSGFEMGGRDSSEEDEAADADDSFSFHTQKTNRGDPLTPPPAKTTGASLSGFVETPPVLATPSPTSRSGFGFNGFTPLSGRQAQCLHCAATCRAHAAVSTELHRTELLVQKLRREKETLSLDIASARDDTSAALATVQFTKLDTDCDGFLSLDDLLRAEVFASYAQLTVERIWEQWVFCRSLLGVRGGVGGGHRDGIESSTDSSCSTDSGRSTDDKGFICLDEFRTLIAFAAAPTSSPQSWRFWWRVVDVDGDGVLSVHDIKWLYDQVWKDGTQCVSLGDLTCQIFDMVGPETSPMSNQSDSHTTGTNQNGRAVGVSRSALKNSGLADGVIKILCNHDDMLLRRSTAEFSSGEHAVPM